MPIEPIDIKFMKSVAISDIDSNGGRMSTNEAASGVKNNLWSDVPQSERLTGSTKYRKTFVKIANSASLKFFGARLFVETPTPGDDRVLIFLGSQTDVQSDISGGVPHAFGCGNLDADVGAGVSVITVSVEDAADAIFAPGDMIRISDKVTVSSPSGSEEFVRIGSNPADVAWVGNVATLTFEPGTILDNAYSAASTRVASVIEVGDVFTNSDTWAVSSTAGLFSGWDGSGATPADITDLRIIDAIAGMEQTWTVTFNSATTFTCVGDTVGPIGGGSVSSDFAPTNAAFSRPYFTIPASLWGGTWAINDVVSFTSHPASIPVWQKRIIPPNTASLSGDRVVIGVSGESE